MLVSDMKDKLRQQTVHSWRELIDEVGRAEKVLKVGAEEELWFRGVSSNRHGLIPSLFRSVPANVLGKHKQLVKIEENLFFEFLQKARISGSQANDHWDTLFLMQHYRVPTRLLDWTEVLGVALHFAVSNLPADTTQTPRLFLMNPYEWNDKHTSMGRGPAWPRYFGYDVESEYFYEYGELLVESDLIDWKNPVALYPSQRDARLAAQRGFFTIHGTDVRAMEEIAPRSLLAIDLAPAAVQEVRENLHHCGISEYALFPDLEGLARQLKQRYQLK